MAGGTDAVGIVGLGLIGMALAKRLLGAGFEVHGYDINPERGALLAAAGGTTAAVARGHRQALPHDPRSQSSIRSRSSRCSRARGRADRCG